jgi:hypothetical protein
MYTNNVDIKRTPNSIIILNLFSLNYNFDIENSIERLTI